MTTSTVVVNTPAATIAAGSPLVKVLIKYPADWKKDKFFKDGDIKEVSPEAAATFVEIAIATIVDDTNEAPVAVTSTDGGEQGNPSNAAQEEQQATEAKKGKKGK